ncbi:uncharacterized protein LOC126575799 [Anopheles aquasalis]|uniref:uncharacterized protein LOC126575799 n=1 Tax=Anopheles aquasalis TaxID=42839 RepID=UPI00215A204B|nr:uncharacterized protein LOC126575799 [Anopheles aquasalis]XP_050092624.1 uncharacterized protein LOC126575799 [Anopheles aquasalis]XP_050092625.1 uncharacterized protein LOC126575799 [Anopheles aquasalis]XP_050092626.1 uncharacterized protein LOC126575799 [Anopheles aquasalis]XP_050092627.1 uncharacterized protein LOC126575799 [Anopheles aquasalis]
MKQLSAETREQKLPNMNHEEDTHSVVSQICRSSTALQVDTPKLVETEESKILHQIDITRNPHSSSSRRTSLRRVASLRDDASSSSSSVINDSNEYTSQHSKKQFNNDIPTKLHLTKDLLTPETRLVCSLPLERLHSILESLNLTKQSNESVVNSGELEMSLYNTNNAICEVLCLYCDRTFNNRQLMLKHSDRTHRLLKKRRSSTRIITAASSTDVSFCCSICNKGMVFSPASQDLTRLFKHMIKFHADQYHACEHCFMRFPNEESRKAHLRLMHTPVPATTPKSKAALKAFSSGIPCYSSTNIVKLDSIVLQENQTQTEDVTTKNDDGDEEHLHRTTTTCSEDKFRSNIRLRSSHRNCNRTEPLNYPVNASESKSKCLKKSERLVMRNTEPMLLSRLGIAQHRLPRQSRRLLEAATPSSLILSDISVSTIVRCNKKKVQTSIADEFVADNCNEKVTKSKRFATSISPICSSAISRSAIDMTGCRSKAHEHSSFSYMVTSYTSNNNIHHRRSSGSAFCSTNGIWNSSSIIIGGSAEHVTGNNSNNSTSNSNALFDEDFYENVTNNVHQNLNCYLDGKLHTSMPNTPSPMSPVVLMPAVRSTVVKSPFSTESMIHEATNLPTVTVSFPTLLTAEQCGRDSMSNSSVVSKTRKPITKQSWKWKWDFVKKYKYVNENGRIVKKIKQPMLGLRDLTKLDMWTQLSMRSKHECSSNHAETLQNSRDRPILEVGAVLRQEKRIMVEQLDKILNARLFPPIDLEQQDQRKVKLESNIVENNPAFDIYQCSATVESSDSPSSVLHQEKEFLHKLQLVQLIKNPYQESIVLSGEWARPRCYVCYGCGRKFASLKQMEEHHIARHPHVYSTFYEIVGRELIENHLYHHFFIPLTALTMQRLYCENYLHGDTTNDHTSINWANSHRMSIIGNHEIKNEDSSSNEATSFSTLTTASSSTSSSYSNSFNSSGVMLSSFVGENCKSSILTLNTDVRSGAIVQDSNPLVCSKCFKECSNLLMLYAHILHCSNDYYWLQAKKRMKYRRTKRRRGGGYRTINNFAMALVGSEKNMPKAHKFMVQTMPAESASLLLPSDTPKTILQVSSNISINEIASTNEDPKNSKSSKLKESDGDIVNRLLADFPEKRISRQMLQIKLNEKHTSNRSNGSSFLNTDIVKLCKNTSNHIAQSHSVTNRATRRIATENSVNTNARKLNQSLLNMGKLSLMKKNVRQTANGGLTCSPTTYTTKSTAFKSREASQATISKKSTTSFFEVKKTFRKPRITGKDSTPALSRAVILKVAGKKKQVSKNNLFSKGTVVIKNVAKLRKNTIQLRNLSKVRHTAKAECNDKKIYTVAKRNVVDDGPVESTESSILTQEFLQNDQLEFIEHTSNGNEQNINHLFSKNAETTTRISKVDKNEIYSNTVDDTTQTVIDPLDLNYKKQCGVISCETLSQDDNEQPLASSESDILQTKSIEPSQAFRMPLQICSQSEAKSEKVRQSPSVHIKNSSPPVLDILKQPFGMTESHVNYKSSVSLAVDSQPMAHKRRPKKLNDCIAMLTGKLSERFGVDFFSQSDRNISLNSNSSVPVRLSPTLKCSSEECEMLNIPEKQNSHKNHSKTLIVPQTNINTFPQDAKLGESNTEDVLLNNELTNLLKTPEKPMSTLVKQSVNTSAGDSGTFSKCIIKELKVASHEKSTSTITSPIDEGYTLQLERLNGAQESEVSDEPLNLCKNNSLCSKSVFHASNYSHCIFPIVEQKFQQTSLAFNGVLATMAHSIPPHQKQKLTMSHDTRYEHQINHGTITQQRDDRASAILIPGVPAPNSLSVKPNDGSGNLASIKLPPGLIIERVECKQSRPIVTKEIPSVTIVARNRSPLRTVDKRNLKTPSCSINCNSSFKSQQQTHQQPHTTNVLPVLMDKHTGGSTGTSLKANENVLVTHQYKLKQKKQEFHAHQQLLNLKDNDLSSDIRNVGERVCHERGSSIENNISVTITTANRIEPHQVTVCGMEKNSLYQAKNKTMTYTTGRDEQNKNAFECMPITSITTSSASSASPVSPKFPQLITKNHTDKPGPTTLVIPQVSMPQPISKRPRRKSFFAALPSRRSPILSVPVDTNTKTKLRNIVENNAARNVATLKDIGLKHWSPTISGANLFATMSLSLLPSSVFNDSPLGLDLHRLASVRLPSHLKPPEIPPLTIPSLGSASRIEHMRPETKRSREKPACDNARFINSDKLLTTISSLQCSSISEKKKPNISKNLIKALKEGSSNLSDEQGSISKPADLSICSKKAMTQGKVCNLNDELGTARENVSLSDNNGSSAIMSSVVHPLERKMFPTNCSLANDTLEARNSHSCQEKDKQSFESPQQPIEHAKQTMQSLVKNPSTLQLGEPNNVIKSIINKQNTTKVTVIHEKNEVNDDASTQMLPDSVKSTSNNGLVSPMQKVTRKRRKNELASILSDQLLESFKEVDKSKLHDLKLLHDITCQTPDVKFSLEQIPQLAKRKSNKPRQEVFESFVRGTTENEVKQNTPFNGQKSSRSKTPVRKRTWTEQHQIFGKGESISNISNSQGFSTEPINNLIRDSSLKQDAPIDVVAPVIKTSSKQITNESVIPIIRKSEKNSTIKQSVNAQESMPATMATLKDKSKTNRTMLERKITGKRNLVVNEVNESTGPAKGKKIRQTMIESSDIKASSYGIVTCNKRASDKTIAENGMPINIGTSVRTIRKAVGKKESKNDKVTDEHFVNRRSLKERFLREGNARTSSELSSASVHIIDSNIPVRETVGRITRRKSVFVDRDLAQYMSETKTPEVNCFKDDLILTSRRGTRSQGNKSLILVNNFVEATMKPRDPRRRLVQKRLETEQCNVIPLDEEQKTDGFPLILSKPTSNCDNTCNATNDKYCLDHPTREDIPMNTRARQKEKFPVRRILTRRTSVFVRIPTPDPPERSSRGETALPPSTRSDENLRTISNETKRIYRRRASIYLPSELLEQTEKKTPKNLIENVAMHLETKQKESTTNNRSKMTTKGESIRGKCDPLIESLLLQTDASSPSGAKKRTTKNSQIAESFSKLFNIQEEIMLIDSTKRKFKKNNTINIDPSPKEATNDEQQCTSLTTVKTRNFFSFASGGNSESQTTVDIKAANKTNYDGSDKAMYGDSADDNKSPACFEANRNCGRGEYSTNVIRPAILIQPSTTNGLPYSNGPSGRAMSMIDDESTMNTDGMDDDMSVTTDIPLKNAVGSSGRRRRKRLMSARRGSKLQRRKAKTNVEIGKPVVTYNCDLCKKFFKKQDAYNKHRMTLTHIAKLSEQEFLLLQQKTAVSNDHIRPTVYDSAPGKMALMNTIVGREEGKLCEINAEAILIHDNNSATELLEPTTTNDPVKTLSQEEKLFYECCSMLKESNAVDVPDGPKLNVTVSLKSIEEGSINSNLSSLNHNSYQASLSRSLGPKINGNSATTNESCYQLFRDLKQTADLKMVDGPMKYRNVMTSNDDPKNQTKPATGTCFLSASHITNNNNKIKTKGALKGYDNFKVSAPMTKQTMEVCDETSAVTANDNYADAKDSRLETLADIALCSNIPNDFGSMRQSHIVDVKEVQRENQIAPPNDSMLATKTPGETLDPLSTLISSDCAAALKKDRTTNIKCIKRVQQIIGTKLSRHVNKQSKSSNRTTRNSEKKTENCSTKSKITPLSVNAERTTSDADVYAFQDSPCEGIALPSFTSKKYSTALQLPELSEKAAIANHQQHQNDQCMDHDDNQMSNLSFSDRYDYAYGSNTLTDEDEADESELRNRKDVNKSSSNRSAVRTSKNGGKADVKRKCLIMGRIFRKGGNKEKIKGNQRIEEESTDMINLDGSAASASVNADKKDYDKLFDTLKNADDVDCKLSSKGQVSIPNEDDFNHVRHGKLVEPWDSEEYEDFHTDDIMQLLEDAEIDEQQQPLTSTFAVNQAPPNSQPERLDDNLCSRQEIIDGSSNDMLDTSSTLGIDARIDQNCSELGVVTDYTIRKVMESVILETMSKNNQKTINKKKSASPENFLANNIKSALCRRIPSIDTFNNHKRSIKELAGAVDPNEIQSKLPTSIEEHVLESSVLISSRTITTKFKQKLNSSLQRSTISKQHDGQCSNMPKDLLKKNEETAKKTLETTKSSSIDKPECPSTTAFQKNADDTVVGIPSRAELYQSSSRGFKRMNKGVSHTSDTLNIAAIKEKNAALKTVFERENHASGNKDRKLTANKQRKPPVKKMKNVAYDPDSDFEDNIKCKKVKRKLLESDIEGNLKMEKLKSTLNDNTILLPLPRRKRSAGDMLYYWSSTSDEDYKDGQDSDVNVELESKRMKSGSKTEFIVRDVVPSVPSYSAISSRRLQKSNLTARGRKMSKNPKCDSRTFSKSKNTAPSKKSQKIIKTQTCVAYNKVRKTIEKEKNKEERSSGMYGRKKNNCFEGIVSLDPSKADGFDGETNSSSDQLQQHGWIVGDSHKKLVTLLAHAKGKQDSRKAINQRRK